MLQPIHYSLALGIATVLGGTAITLHMGQPVVYVVSVVLAYVLGGNTIGRFDAGEKDDDPAYDGGNGAGFQPPTGR